MALEFDKASFPLESFVDEGVDCEIIENGLLVVVVGVVLGVGGDEEEDENGKGKRNISKQILNIHFAGLVKRNLS